MANTHIAQNISVIPATKRFVQAGGQLSMHNVLRIGAYCRVSTGDESQQTSYTNQKSYYEQMVNRKDNWTLVGIFADEGITGTSTRRRKEFQRMMDLALRGEMDYIVTKSISRFARNTVDTLSCVRQLREMNPPVGVYFEKENIDTLDAKGELILTILSALAQDESRSISDNIKWTIQKNFERGIPHLNPDRILGYKKGPNGEWLVDEEQAAIVRTIFRNYVAGWSAGKIADELNKAGYKTGKNCRWRTDAVLYILRKPSIFDLRQRHIRPESPKPLKSSDTADSKGFVFLSASLGYCLRSVQSGSGICTPLTIVLCNDRIAIVKGIRGYAEADLLFFLEPSSLILRRFSSSLN